MTEEHEELDKGELLHLKKMSCEKGNHEWEMVATQDVKCRKCPVGFYLPPGGELREGQVYINGALII